MKKALDTRNNAYHSVGRKASKREQVYRVIAKHESITIKDDIFDRFINACAKARKPNKTLLDAAAFTKDQGIE